MLSISRHNAPRIFSGTARASTVLSTTVRGAIVLSGAARVSAILSLLGRASAVFMVCAAIQLLPNIALAGPLQVADQAVFEEAGAAVWPAVVARRGYDSHREGARTGDFAAGDLCKHGIGIGDERIIEAGDRPAVGTGDPPAVGTGDGRGVGFWDGRGPWGGNVRSLVASPHDGARVLCACGFSWATESGGIWVSESGGTSWRDTGFPPMPVYALAASPSEPGVHYAAAYRGLYRSIDDGESWARIAFPNQFIIGTGVKVDDGNVLIAGLSSDQGIRRSGDGGSSWDAVGVNTGYLKGVGASPLDPDRMYIAMSSEPSAVLRSDNGGLDWTPIGPFGCSGFGLYVDPSDPDRVFVTVALNGPYGIHRTTDGGTTWEHVLDGLSYAPVVEKDGVLYAAIMDQGVCESTDGGDTWTPFSEGIVEDFWQAGAASSTHVLFGHWGGIYRSEPARSAWVVSQDGLDNAFVHSIAFYADTNELWAGTEESGLWRSLNGGETWELMVNGLDSWTIMGIAPQDHSRFLVDRMVVATYDGVYTSDDGGATWDPAGLQGERLSDVAIHWTDPDCLWAGVEVSDIWRSTDGGDTWLPGSGLPFMLYPDIEVGDGPFGLRVLVAYQELLGALGVAYYSDDGGATFTPGTGLESADMVPMLSARLASPDGRAGTPAPRLDAIWYCGTDNGVYRSHDCGETWERAGTLGGIMWSVHGTMTTDVYAGRQGMGVYRSVNEGNDWELYNGGIETATVWSLAYGPTSDFVFAGTRGWGVVGIAIEGASSVEDTPPGVRLVTACPNPFTSSSVLSFSAAAAGEVRMRIFDVSGRPVFSRRIGSGPGNLLWRWCGRSENGEALPSGTYYYDVNGAGIQARGRWVILR